MFTTPAEIFRVAVTLDDADVSPKAIGVYGVRYLTGEPVLLSVIDATQAAAGDVLTVDVFQYAGEKSALLKTLRRAVRQS
jgi:hypothetical protein